MLQQFQRCMFAIFADLLEKGIEVFMDDFSVYGSTFSSCLKNLDIVLKRCRDQSCPQLGKMSLYGERGYNFRTQNL